MLAAVAQFVRDRLMETPTRGAWNRLRGGLLNRAERWILRREDPLVRVRIGKFNLDLPLSHKLPLVRRAAPSYSLNLPRIARAVLQKYPQMTCIDIGANVGDSVALLRSEAVFPILCIEGDGRYFPLLQRNTRQFHDVELHEAYVGEADDVIAGGIDHANGTARIDTARQGHDVRVFSLQSLVQQHPRFTGFKLLKIDTDGFDAKIIRGSASILRSAQPIVFFEYDPHLLAQQRDDGLSAFATLSDARYGGLIVYDNLGQLLPSLRCQDAAGLKKLHDSCGKGKPLEYVDIAAFPGQDEDLFRTTLNSEIEHSRALQQPANR